MLCLILIVGGLLIMMGQHDRSEALFYYFRLEDQVPETHLLRLIDKHISFEFVRQQMKDSYSETGRPSIDPELLLRILLIGYLYGITKSPPRTEPRFFLKIQPTLVSFLGRSLACCPLKPDTIVTVSRETHENGRQEKVAFPGIGKTESRAESRQHRTQGRPLSFFLSDGGQPLPTYGAQRPNIVGTPKRNHGSDWVDNYFVDPNVFQVPDPFTL